MITYPNFKFCQSLSLLFCILLVERGFPNWDLLVSCDNDMHRFNIKAWGKRLLASTHAHRDASISSQEYHQCQRPSFFGIVKPRPMVSYNRS